MSLFIIITWVILTVFIGASGSIDKLDLNKNKFSILIRIKNFTKNLFYNKNYFGITLSLFIFIISLPAILIFALLQIIILIICLCRYMWELGKKKGE